MKYTVVSNDNVSTITALVNGDLVPYTTDDEARFSDVLNAALDDDVDRFLALTSPAKAVERNFSVLSDRVAVKGGTIYFDWEPVDNSVTEQILRFLDEGADFAPLVKFMEKLYNYRSNQSIDQVYSWLRANEFALSENGNVIGYKAVTSRGGGVLGKGDGVFVPSHCGHGFVNGKEVNGLIEQRVGDVVSIPRGEVAFDPAVACSTGLHVASWNYARGFHSGDTILLVEVDPRDIVSVPTDSNQEKIRVSRYTVVKALPKDDSARVSTAFLSVQDENEEDDPYCSLCGDNGHESDECDEELF